MKSFQLDHAIAELIAHGQLDTIVRLPSDDSIVVHDEVRIIDMGDPQRVESWNVIGSARIEQIIEKQLGSLTDSDIGAFGYSSLDTLITTLQNQNNNDVSETTILSVVKILVTSDQQISDVSNTTKMMKKLKIYTDGGSRGNPGPSAGGYVILDATNDMLLVDKGVYFGVTTNNQAEYLALKFALIEANAMGATDIFVYMDSMMVVNQIKGLFKVKNRDLWPVHEAIRELLKSFTHTSFTHVPRELNRPADTAVNRTLDAQQSAANTA
ncbi:MAG TPA: ribonuclease HI family protein [Candidatus Saccharimonadales bacterium]|jgi:ribonuclease HI